MTLQTLNAKAMPSDMVTALHEDGAVIVRDALDQATLAAMVEQVTPFIERTPMGRDDFSGRSTQRTGALVARTPACREIVLHPEILAAARAFLGQYTEKIILHLTQTINIGPGQGRQPLHRDRLAWGGYLPREIEPQFNTIYALTDFTAENGATRVVPGSHAWDDARRAEENEVCQAEMTKGSVLLYTGSVLHGGGTNESTAPRLGLNVTYCLGWLRQEENQYLSCPPHIARDLAPELQELLGYTMGSYALGYYSDPEAPDPRSDILVPEAALGRRPR